MSLTEKVVEDGRPLAGEPRSPEQAAKDRPAYRSFLDSLEAALKRLAEQGNSFAQRNGD
jgi:hypothetical protein